ncbi:cytidylate kinase [Methyloceanibacter superfactus]|jgi:CMP/dCMP kinase|uniref:Cytidylate kinase n=1 Tax=Methyloceanibacter superfactus TaxID=1774969 RepID=A0A1E3W7J0_9HYPH|nr:(d)CMP kinase [Methyloceanibacter superfactus]ODS01764.1 cytidylate kinase [Methyloceanibacter superfactus]
MIIAIDGPAASGKGTVAKRIAVHYGLRHLDTGALYRAVARDTLAQGGELADSSAAAAAASRLDVATLDDPVLRTAGLGEAASVVARHPEVRAVLLAYQREFVRIPPGAVIDGRDIGTVICPNADVKLFVTATPEERAHRRFLELQAAGAAIAEAEVLADIRDRDQRDMTRTTAPLRQAEDAALLDTTNLDIDAAFRAAIDLVEAAMGNAGRAD